MLQILVETQIVWQPNNYQMDHIRNLMDGAAGLSWEEAVEQTCHEWAVEYDIPMVGMNVPPPPLCDQCGGAGGGPVLGPDKFGNYDRDLCDQCDGWGLDP
jgi:hypothetical protein